MTTNTNTYKIGTVVRFGDQYDSTYAIIGIDLDNPWNTYTLLDLEDYTITTSDLAQPAWEVVAN